MNAKWSPPSREAILDALRGADRPLSPAALAELLGVSGEHVAILQRRLIAMERDGQLLPNRKGVLLLASRLDLVAGRVQGHRDGFGFLIPDAGGPDCFLSPREMQKVMHGDRVLARPSGYDARGRPEAMIVEVTDRAHRALVGRFINERGVHIVVPEDQRIKHDIIIAPADTGSAQHGQVVSIEILSPPLNGAPPIGRVVEVLGEIDDPGMEIEIAVRKFDVPHTFGEGVVTHVAGLPAQVRPADRRGRIDLRDLGLVTIDGEDARDFDDAVYCEAVDIEVASDLALDTGYLSRAEASAAGPAGVVRDTASERGDGEAPRRAHARTATEPGFRLIVAIADVAHYVRPGDPVDREAQERGTSVYFPRRVIPMLPEHLSNGLCSLNPQVDRLVLVCDALIDRSGTIRAYQFYEAVMCSAARFTYEEVWALLSGSTAATMSMSREKLALLPRLTVLHELYRVLIGARNVRGAIEIETVETRIVCDALGRIEEIVPYARNDAHKLIEECMLAANVCAADLVARNDHPGLFRVHEGPTADRLTQLRELLRSVGLSLGGGSAPTPSDYARLAGLVRGRPDEAMLQTMILRSMQQAIYTPDNVGHFGLAYRAYTHFTSPIRRYPDLLTHRVIKALLRGRRFTPSLAVSDEDSSAGLQVPERWQHLGVMCSSHERRADEASRDVAAWLKCQFMRERVGEQFSGRVTGVAPFGLFVTLNDLYVEGLVHVSELGGEYFQFSDAAHELRGERTGRRFRLTDPIDVQVSRVDLEARRIEFRMIPSLMTEARRRDGGSTSRAGLAEAGRAAVPRTRKAAPAKSEAVRKARAERGAAGKRNQSTTVARGKPAVASRRKRRS